MFEKLLTRLFKHEEINGGHRCPTYMHRWTLFQPSRPKKLWRGFGIYVHKFIGDDWSRDLHDHPKRFVSVGLKGSYREWTPDPSLPIYGAERCRVYSAPWVRTFPAEHIHRIELLPDRRPCWTLVIVLWHVREWGFHTPGGWMFWRDYLKSEAADRAKSCP